MGSRDEPFDNSLARLCVQAVHLHGANWPRIDEHIRNSIAALPESERLRLEFENQHILDFERFQGASESH
jgi:hypothetical protein